MKMAQRPVQHLGANSQHKKRSVAPPEPDLTTVHEWYLWAKAAFDFAAAAVLLILAAPLLVLAASAVRLTSRGPAFYSQTRVGRHGRTYTIFKLRTMVDNAEALSGPVWSPTDDPRITPFGQFLRETHIDELPQLINVLLGQMSLVGPRPERPEFVRSLQRDLPDYRRRLDLRPGITGLAQVKLPPDTDLESVRRKLAHDLYYVRNVNPWLDIRILAYTAAKFCQSLAASAWRLLALPTCDWVEQEAYCGMKAER